MWDGFQKYLMKSSLLQENKQYHHSGSDRNMNSWLGLRRWLGHEQGHVSYYTVQECLDDTEDPLLVLFFHCNLMLCLSI